MHRPRPWRLVLDPPRDGPANMAIDEALVLSAQMEWGQPTLRLYSWEHPTVSVGYLQSIEGVIDPIACRALGIPLVRRPTGGGALLHHRELTYSLALPLPNGNRGVLHDYRWISRCLLLGLRRLGVAARLSQGRRGAERGRGLCFLAPSRYELAVDGRKLVGSAQRRLSRALLQHGSILIAIDYPRWTAVFPHGTELISRATALEPLLGRSCALEELADALVGGFMEGEGVQFEIGGLTAEEQALAQELLVKRYRNTEWTLHRPRGAPKGRSAGVRP